MNYKFLNFLTFINLLDNPPWPKYKLLPKIADNHVSEVYYNKISEIYLGFKIDIGLVFEDPKMHDGFIFYNHLNEELFLIFKNEINENFKKLYPKITNKKFFINQGKILGVNDILSIRIISMYNKTEKELFNRLKLLERDYKIKSVLDE